MKSVSQKIEIKEVGDIDVEITAEIPKEHVLKRYNKILEEKRKDIQIDGFRKGKAPMDAVENIIGQDVLMQEVARSLVEQEYPLIVKEKELEVLGKPEITITKLAPGNELGFKIKATLMPTVKLGDYRKIAKRSLSENPMPEIEVSETEKKETIHNILMSYYIHTKREKGEDVPSPESIKEEELPELTDEIASKLGSFANATDFEKKIEEHIKKEKENREKERRWTKMIEDIIKESTITTPAILVDHELEKMIAQLKEDVKKAGLEYSEYLKKINKTEEDILSEWRENAKKRAETQLALNDIAKKENIKSDPEVVEAQTKQLLEHYKEAEPEAVKIFVQTQLANEKTFYFLCSLEDDSEGKNKKPL